MAWHYYTFKCATGSSTAAKKQKQTVRAAYGAREAAPACGREIKRGEPGKGRILLEKLT